MLILLEERALADASRPREAELASLRLKGTLQVRVVGMSRVGIALTGEPSGSSKHSGPHCPSGQAGELFEVGH